MADAPTLAPQPLKPLPASAAPFPQGDPRNAKYFENLAALEHNRGKTETEDKRGREETESEYKYNTGQLQKGERLAIRGNMNTANAQGLLQSGILAGRQANTQTQYLAKQHTIDENRRKAIDRYNRADQTARETYEKGTHGLLTDAQIEAFNNLKANPPAPPPEGTGPYPKAEAYVAQMFPGGIAEQRAWIKEQARKKAIG